MKEDIKSPPQIVKKARNLAKMFSTRYWLKKARDPIWKSNPSQAPGPYGSPLGSKPLYAKIPIFRVAQMEQWMPPLERARKTGQENGMVRYDSMKTSRDISRWNYIYFADSALFSLFSRFLWNFDPSYLEKFSSK